jgi:DNA polymerase III subunit gamma/tau
MTLYRKYRPTKFSEVVGRDANITILKEELRTGKISHAYLFSGTRGTGKTTMARILAKALNCEKRDKKTQEPCNTCASCKAISVGNSQDLIEIDAASNRRIEEIRELREQVKYLPATAPYKVYIIDEVHMLTPEAFNALLKTLEEPPEHAIFILATTELHKIPDTIFSRCQHFSFGKLSLIDITKRLSGITKKEGIEVEVEVTNDIARRSGGALRDAESLLGQILSIGKKKINTEDASLFLPKAGAAKTIPWLSSLINKEARDALSLLNEIEHQGSNLIFFLQEALETARQMVLLSITKDAQSLELHFSPDEILEITSLCESTTTEELRKILVELLRASQEIKLSPDIQILPIELAVVVLCENTHQNTMPQQAVSQEAMPKKELPKTKTIDSIRPIVKADIQAQHSLEEILDGWGEVLAQAKNKSQALNFVLGVAEPLSINGNTLELGFKYRLQQEKVLEFKNREVVETIIKEVYGASYRIEPKVQEDIVINKQNKEDIIKEDELVKAALEVFPGAELIT